jgi:hypothetical protein
MSRRLLKATDPAFCCQSLRYASQLIVSEQVFDAITVWVDWSFAAVGNLYVPTISLFLGGLLKVGAVLTFHGSVDQNSAWTSPVAIEFGPRGGNATSSRQPVAPAGMLLKVNAESLVFFRGELVRSRLKYWPMEAVLGVVSLSMSMTLGARVVQARGRRFSVGVGTAIAAERSKVRSATDLNILKGISNEDVQF